MKIFNIVKNVGFLTKPILYSILIIFLAFLLQIMPANDIEGISILDLVSELGGDAGITNILIMVFIIVPLITFSMFHVLKNTEVHYKLLRLQSRVRIWNNIVILIIIYSFIFSIFLVLGGYIISGIFLNDFTNNWINMQGSFFYLLDSNDQKNFAVYSEQLTTTRVLTILFFTKFLGLLVIAILITILKAILKKSIWVILIMMIFSFLDGINNDVSILFGKMTINIDNWKNIQSIFLNHAFLLTIFVTLYFVGLEIYRKRDFVK